MCKQSSAFSSSLCPVTPLSSYFPWIKSLDPYININSSIKINGRRAEGFNLCWSGKEHGLTRCSYSPTHCSSLRRAFLLLHPFWLTWCHTTIEFWISFPSTLIINIHIFWFLRLYEADHLATKTGPFCFIS